MNQQFLINFPRPKIEFYKSAFGDPKVHLTRICARNVVAKSNIEIDACFGVISQFFLLSFFRFGKNVVS